MYSAVHPPEQERSTRRYSLGGGSSYSSRRSGSPLYASEGEGSRIVRHPGKASPLLTSSSGIIQGLRDQLQRTGSLSAMPPHEAFSEEKAPVRANSLTYRRGSASPATEMQHQPLAESVRLAYSAQRSAERTSERIQVQHKELLREYERSDARHREWIDRLEAKLRTATATIERLNADIDDLKDHNASLQYKFDCALMEGARDTCIAQLDGESRQQDSWEMERQGLVEKVCEEKAKRAALLKKYRSLKASAQGVRTHTPGGSTSEAVVKNLSETSDLLEATAEWVGSIAQHLHGGSGVSASFTSLKEVGASLQKNLRIVEVALASKGAKQQQQAPQQAPQQRPVIEGDLLDALIDKKVRKRGFNKWLAWCVLVKEERKQGNFNTTLRNHAELRVLAIYFRKVSLFSRVKTEVKVVKQSLLANETQFEQVLQELSRALPDTDSMKALMPAPQVIPAAAITPPAAAATHSMPTEGFMKDLTALLDNFTKRSTEDRTKGEAGLQAMLAPLLEQVASITRANESRSQQLDALQRTVEGTAVKTEAHPEEMTEAVKQHFSEAFFAALLSRCSGVDEAGLREVVRQELAALPAPPPPPPPALDTLPLQQLIRESAEQQRVHIGETIGGVLNEQRAANDDSARADVAHHLEEEMSVMADNIQNMIDNAQGRSEAVIADLQQRLLSKDDILADMVQELRSVRQMLEHTPPPASLNSPESTHIQITQVESAEELSDTARRADILEGQLRDVVAEASTLSESLKKAENKTSRLESELGKARGHIEQLAGAAKRASASCRERIADVEAVEQVEEMRSDLLVVRKSLSTLQEAEAAAKVQEIISLEAELRERDEEINTLKAELLLQEDVTKELAQAHQRIAGLESLSERSLDAVHANGVEGEDITQISAQLETQCQNLEQAQDEHSTVVLEECCIEVAQPEEHSAQIRTLEGEMAMLQETHEANISALSEQLQRLETSVANQNEASEEGRDIAVTAELATLTEAHSALQAEHHSAVNELEEKKREISQITAQLEEQTQCQTLNELPTLEECCVEVAQPEEHSAQIRTLEGEMAVLRETHEGHMSAVTEQMQEITDAASEDIEEKNAEIASLTEALTALQSHSQRVVDLEAELAVHANALNEKNTEISEISAQLEEQINQREALEQTQDERSTVVLEECCVEVAQLEEHSAQIRTLEGEMAVLRETHEGHMSAITEQMQEITDAASEDIEEKNAEIASLTEAHSVLQSEHRAHASELEEKNANLLKISTQLEEQTKRRAELEEATSRFTDVEEAKLKTLKEGHNEQVAALTSQNETLIQQLQMHALEEIRAKSPPSQHDEDLCEVLSEEKAELSEALSTMSKKYRQTLGTLLSLLEAKRDDSGQPAVCEADLLGLCSTLSQEKMDVSGALATVTAKYRKTLDTLAKVLQKQSDSA